MKRNRLAAGALVVVAGLLAGWWWFRDREAATPDATTSAERRPGSAGPRERADRPVDPEAGRAVVIDDDPVGALRLEGQVLDAEDHPVNGATVVLGANPPRTATTEADGAFAFDRLVGRPYTLIARATGGVAGPVTARLTARSEPVVLRLRPAGRLTVTVVGAGGQPIEGATVELRGLDVQRARLTTGPAVFAPVVPGDYQIAAWADGKARAFQRIRLGAGEARARLTLSAGAPVAGRVVDDRGAGIANARVRYSAASAWGAQADGKLDGALTAADGSFRFDALPAGSFRFLASHPERAPGASPLITLDGATPRAGIVVTLAIGAIVRGRVVDAQHQPVASARVRVGGGERGPRAQGEAPRQAYSDAQGAFELTGLPRKALAAVALHELGASEVVAVDTTAGDVVNLTLTLDVTGTIAGTVVDPQGKPLEGAQVTAGPSFAGGRGAAGPLSWGLRGLPQELTDAGGRFTLTGLAPGEYRLSAGPARARGPGRGGRRDGVTARTGDRDVRLVLEPDGGVRGRVAFADGTAPELFTVGVPQVQQAFGGGDGAFALDGIAPGTYQLDVRGPTFQATAVEVVIGPGALADAGSITVIKGRAIGGVVVADGQPVAGATVYAGRTVLGNGTTSAAGSPGPGQGGFAAALAGATKSTTTGPDGAFALSGFPDGDLTLVAEQDAVGRSRALRLTGAMPGQTELTLTLEKFGALAGVVTQPGAPADGVVVTCQSTTTPGAVYTVGAGADGAYRFDRLAPDTYKVSATLVSRRVGLHQYSRQVEVPPGKEVTVNLAVEPGAVTLAVTSVARTGTVGMVLVWLATGSLSARTASELTLALAAAGPGASQRVIARGGEPAQLTQVAPGPYGVCVTPLPAEVRGIAALGYLDRHGDTLPAFCAQVTVAPSPDRQATQVAVDVPAFIPDSPGPGSGDGPGPGSGAGSAR